MNWLVYNVQSGQIVNFLLCPPSDLTLNISSGHSVVLGEWDIESEATHYVVHETGTLHEKADYTLDAIPLPATITIEGVTYEVSEQPTFEFDVPGTYNIQVDAGPKFLQKEFVIDYQA